MKSSLALVVNIVSLLLVFNGIFIFLCLPVSLAFEDGNWDAFLLAGGISVILGTIGWMPTQKSREGELRKKDGYLVVALGWIVLTLSGSLPYVFSGAIPTYADAFFETMSGYTTTGATIVEDIEAMAPSILFWRSFTQWLGGMGMIVLAVAVLPILGIGGMQLFIAEAPGLTPDKIRPRIRETAKRLWFIYLGLTAAEFILLMLSGMSAYEAINHSFTTVSSGGFSPKQNSIAYYNSPLIDYIIIIFMLLAGTNFTMTYFALHGRFKKVFTNDEFKFYYAVVVVAACIVTISVFLSTDNSLEKAFRDSLFQVTSIITTTGYVTADYTGWIPFLTIFFFLLMFLGGSAGSTAGGVKIVRHLILLRNSLLEFRRQLHPSAVLPVRFNTIAVPQEVTLNVLAFIITYILIFILGSIIMSAIGLDFITSMGAVASCLGNIGPGIGQVGPVDDYAWIPTGGKWILSFFMILGRLELFTILILFTPYYWRSL